MNKKNNKRMLGKVIFGLTTFVFLLLSYSLKWAKQNYANIGLAEIIFHLNMTKKGTSEDLLISYFTDSLIPAIIISIVLVGACIVLVKKYYYLEIVLKRKKLYINLKIVTCMIIYAYWLILLFYLTDQEFAVVEFCKNQIQQSDFIENEYINPEEVGIIFPEEKRNLICIYIESGETTFQDKENGGIFDVNYMPEMTAIAKENVSFSQSEKLEGAAVAPACGWTIAGLVAETAGLPLKLFGYDSIEIDNSMDEYNHFLPGTISLGDILEKEGYKNYFMAGSEFEFGGRTVYFTQHGNYEIWDYNSAKEEMKIPEDYKVFWGFEDQKLYQFAKEKILEIATGEQPFNFSMLTVDTHQPHGYTCEVCQGEYREQYANVWACASRQLADFLLWLEQQEFYENTTIVIMGDHCSMSGDLVDGSTYSKHNGSVDRKVYNAFINAAEEPVNEKNRMFTTMDMFPTVLASIGVKIEGNKLALGTNLFSEEPTLAEEYGYEVLFEELNKKSLFYDQELLYP